MARSAYRGSIVVPEDKRALVDALIAALVERVPDASLSRSESEPIEGEHAVLIARPVTNSDEYWSTVTTVRDAAELVRSGPVLVVGHRRDTC